MAESISEGTLKTWLKQVGDSVAQDEEIATIETDKVCPLVAADCVLRCPYAPYLPVIAILSHSVSFRGSPPVSVISRGLPGAHQLCSTGQMLPPRR